ncbi:MAG: DNA-binding protein [Lachnospiraceae bacterium]|nr:DNA-binding protein [Lachnospiraceae bacterium]
MEKIVRQSLLYDFYGELLTEHQKKIYEDVVMNDMSYSELADIYGISRQGIYDMIKRCDRILEGYEDKLKLVEKFVYAKGKISDIKISIDKIKCENKDSNPNGYLSEIEKDIAELLEIF